MEEVLYELMTLNKNKVVKLQPNPAAGEGPLLCDIQCNMEIKYSPELIKPDNIKCYINPQERFMRIDILNVDNHILYQGANSAAGVSYIKTTDNIISDKYVLKSIFIFFNVGNYVDNQTNKDDIEVRLLHESVNKNESDTKIYIANVFHINGNGGDNSVQSKLYESIFNNILEYKTRSPNNTAYTQTLETMCKRGNDCIASINCSNFIIDNRIDSGFYSYLDINVGHKLYWIIFQKTISIRSNVFIAMKKYMNANIGTPEYITPKNGQSVYINIDGRKYSMKHYLYITPNGTEIPEYAQDEHGIRPDIPPQGQDDKQAQGQSNNTDNLIVLNTPNNKEKVVIEVDRKEHFNSTISTRISDRIFDIVNKLPQKLQKIKENYSTINIRQNKVNDNRKELQIKTILLYILAGLILCYFIIVKTRFYIRIYSLLLYLKMKITGFTLKKRIEGGQIDNSLEETPKEDSSLDITEQAVAEPMVNSSLDITEQSDTEPIKKQQGGRKKYKLGLKKMKRRLI